MGLMVCEFYCHIEADTLVRYLGCNSQISSKYSACKRYCYRSHIFRGQLLCLHKSYKWMFGLSHYQELLDSHRWLRQLSLFLLMIFQLIIPAFLRFFLFHIWNNAINNILYDKSHLISFISHHIFLEYQKINFCNHLNPSRIKLISFKNQTLLKVCKIN